MLAIPSFSKAIALSATAIIFSTLASADSSSAYTLDTAYESSNFFDGWDFFSGPDPTHGFVTYNDRATAFASGLAQTDAKAAYMRVDAQNVYDSNAPYYGSNGHGRPSVRIETQKSWKHGLFIVKVDHMPGGVCGVWPAWWTVGKGAWPQSGEIDMVEGVSNRKQSLAALHTGSNSIISGSSSTMSGQLKNNDCQYHPETSSNAEGCVVLDEDQNSFGTGFNAQGGGTWAMEWTSDAIKIWSWPAGKVPANVDSNSPDPNQGWGLPAQSFDGPSVNIDQNIPEQRMIFDTTFCGDFASAVWESEGCAASTGVKTCAEYVAKNPTAFADMYWQISYLKVYQKGTNASPSVYPTSVSPQSAQTTSQPYQAQQNQIQTSAISSAPGSVPTDGSIHIETLTVTRTLTAIPTGMQISVRAAAPSPTQLSQKETEEIKAASAGSEAADNDENDNNDDNDDNDDEERDSEEDISKEIRSINEREEPEDENTGDEDGSPCPEDRKEQNYARHVLYTRRPGLRHKMIARF